MASTLQHWVAMNFIIILLFVFGLYALSQNSSANEHKPIFPTAPRLEEICIHGEDSCQLAIGQRVVKVLAQDRMGTGFIVHSNDNWAIVMTSSHVIKVGNGHASRMLNTSIYNSSWVGGKAESACAFFMLSYGDVALIRVPNYWGKNFPRIKTDYDSVRGDKAYIVDHKYNYLRYWTYKISGFNNRKKQVYLHDKAEPGMSGSPIISRDGNLIGVLEGTLTNYYYGYKRTIGSYKVDYNDLYDYNHLVDSYNYSSNYICKNF